VERLLRCSYQAPQLDRIDFVGMAKFSNSSIFHVLPRSETHTWEKVVKWLVWLAWTRLHAYRRPTFLESSSSDIRTRGRQFLERDRLGGNGRILSQSIQLLEYFGLVDFSLVDGVASPASQKSCRQARMPRFHILRHEHEPL